MSYLRYSEFMPHAPDTLGEQIHVNHEDCPAGTDTKRRLYVKRCEDGAVIAHCQHCSRSGTSRDTRSRVAIGSSLGSVRDYLENRAGPGETKLTGSTRSVEVPVQKVQASGSAAHDPSKWPIEAQHWLRQYGIEPDKSGWYYEPRLGRLCYTLRDTEGNGVLKNCRGIERKAPKYLTYKTDHGHPRQYMGLHSPVLVVTEDIISAQRCNLIGYAAFPLCTVTVKDKDLVYLTDEFSNVILMLDNDNIEVETKRNTLEQKLILLGIKVVSLKDTTDPKHYSSEELQAILTKASEVF